MQLKGDVKPYHGPPLKGLAYDVRNAGHYAADGVRVVPDHCFNDAYVYAQWIDRHRGTVWSVLAPPSLAPRAAFQVPAHLPVYGLQRRQDVAGRRDPTFDTCKSCGVDGASFTFWTSTFDGWPGYTEPLCAICVSTFDKALFG